MDLVLRLRGGGPPPSYFLDQDTMHAEFDFNFKSIDDAADGRWYTRGGEPYLRPCGWKRHAIRVTGQVRRRSTRMRTCTAALHSIFPLLLQYDGGDDTWLGAVDAPGEWIVSYHGTSVNAGRNIAQQGFDLSKGKRFKFGFGVYSTPTVEVAALFALSFTHNDKLYEMVLQNRVCTKNLVRVEEPDIGTYFVCPQDDIRPYGFLVRRKP